MYVYIYIYIYIYLHTYIHLYKTNIEVPRAHAAAAPAGGLLWQGQGPTGY